MKKLMIERTLCDVVKSWTDSIKDKELAEKVKNDAIIAGGAIVSLLAGEEVNDFDVYFSSQELAKEVQKYYLIKAGISTDNIPAFQVVENKNSEKYYPVIISENAISLSDKIQIITRFNGEGHSVVKRFDFVHCKNFWTKKSGLWLDPMALESIVTKSLMYEGSDFPVCAVVRTRKFLGRGWTCDAGQYIKMLFEVSKLDLSDLDVLKQQLIGVDTLHFVDLIYRLEKIKEETNQEAISTETIMTIIDEIF